jgi:hypothetical protein
MRERIVAQYMKLHNEYISLSKMVYEENLRQSSLLSWFQEPYTNFVLKGVKYRRQKETSNPGRRMSPKPMIL